MTCVFKDGEHGRCQGRLQWHHAVKQQRLKRMFRFGAWRYTDDEWVPIRRNEILPKEAEARPLDAILGDTRNRVFLCSAHHEKVTNGRLKIELPESVWAFAAEFGLTAQLENDLARAA